MKIVVTGGAGYIGSHFVRELLAVGHIVTVIDNLERGHKESLPAEAKFVNENIKNYNNLLKLFKVENFDAIVHFAAFAYVGESVENPGMY